MPSIVIEVVQCKYKCYFILIKYEYNYTLSYNYMHLKVWVADKMINAGKKQVIIDKKLRSFSYNSFSISNAYKTRKLDDSSVKFQKNH